MIVAYNPLTLVEEEDKQILMLKKIILFSTFLFLAIFASPTNAFEPFIKSPSNPLPLTNDFPNWNETGKYQPSVIFDQEIFRMWYASYNGSSFKIIYATSSAGISWTRQNLLDVYPGFDNHDPAILKTQNGYRLFFVASTSGGSQNFRIYKIDSTDGINFDANSRQLILQPTGALESNAVSSPAVIYENGGYYLFYLCWGSQGFRICLATSTDGNQWQRCPNNPIISEVSDGPSIFAKNGKHYLFFQSPLGVRQTETSDNLSCNSTWSNFQTVLPEPIVGPTILDNQNILYLYYSGFGQSGLTINLATSDNQTSPTPTLTATPTHTQTPTPTPASSKNKIVIIPGLLTSWNRDAMLHNINVSQDKWELLPFVKEYDGLIQTLQNLQYEKGKDFFIFAYDWRKKIDSLADDLKQFLIDNNLASSKINLVGHSLGGLIARVYGQKYGIGSIDKIITAGSPHLGTAKTYKLVEAGEIDRDDSLLWLMQKLAFLVNRKQFKTDRETVQSVMPVVKDLFPIYDFLLDKNGDNITIQSMEIKNTTLLGYSAEFPQLFNLLTTLSGDKIKNTLFGHKVGKRTSLNILLGDYPDGRPVGNRFALGDGLITVESAAAGDDQITLKADHGEIIYKKESISAILNRLNIPYNQNQIVEGKGTNISPSLIFALLSPAEMQVDFLTEQHQEEKGLIFIENAQTGDYTLKVKGKSPGGRYAVLVGQVSDTDDKWFEINGEINSLFPFLQTDTYIITFNPDSLLDFPVNQNNTVSLFDLLIQRLRFIKKDYHSFDLGEVIEEAEEAKKEFLKKRYKQMRQDLLESDKEILKLRSRRNAPTTLRNLLYDTLSQLENLYERTSEVSGYTPNHPDLQKKLDNLNKQYKNLEEYLLKQQNNGKDVLAQSASLSQMQEKLLKSQEELSNNNLPLAEILLKSAKELIK